MKSVVGWAGLAVVLFALLLGPGASIGIAQTPPTATSIPVVDSGAVIKAGQSVRGVALGKPGVPRYAIFGAAGSMISIGVFPDVNSPIVPAYDLYAPDGNRVLTATAPLTDPTGAFGRGAIISGYILPVTGAYILYVRAAKGQYGGPFILTVGAGWTLRDLNSGSLTSGVSSRGKIVRIGDRGSWSIDLPANATISVQAAPDQSKLDPLLEVVAPDGKLIGSAHDSGAAHTPQLSNVVTPTQGRYRIRVSGFLNNTVGGYSLLANVLQIVPTATFVTSLEFTQTIQIKQGERYTYAFNGVPGQALQVEVSVQPPDQFAPVIELYGPSGQRLVHQEDPPGNLEDSTDVSLQFSLNDGIGTYTVQVFGYALTPGTFVLHVISR